MEMKNFTKHFIIVVLCLSVIFTAIGTVTKNEIILALQQATPLFSIILICIFHFKDKPFKSIKINKIGNIKYYIAALLIPTITLFISYFAAWLFGLIKFSGQIHAASFKIDVMIKFVETFFLSDIVYLTNFPLVLLWAFAEEIGWRGFLQPRLINKFGIVKGIVITGITWALWHYPLIISGNYYEKGSIIINTILFTITVIIMSISIGYLTYKSNSVWPAVIFHTKSNLTWQLCQYFLFVSNSDKSIYICGEAGIINILIWIIFALIIMYRISKNTNLAHA